MTGPTIPSNSIGARVWRRDTSLWTDDPDAAKEISERLGWLDLPESMRPYVPDLRQFAREVREAGIDRVLVCGMGGSSLCVEVLAALLGPEREREGRTRERARERTRERAREHVREHVREHALPVRVLDSTHPDAVTAAAAWATPGRSLYVISSKSGTTTEPNDFAAYFEALATAELGSAAGGHFVAVTDPGTPLVEHAGAFGYRGVFENPPDIGGRYSALSLFGLVPAALLGVDLDALLERAREMALECGPEVDDATNPGVVLGRFMADNAIARRDKVTVLTAPELSSFGLWVEQLLAESTGKQGKGLLPVVGEPPYPTEAFGDDRAVVGIDFEGTVAPGVSELKAAEFPAMFLGIGEAIELGAEFFRWEFATAVAGHVLGINPFDQPDVQAAKDATRRVLRQLARGGQLPEPEVVVREDADVRAAAELVGEVLDDAGPGRYVALMAFVDPTPESAELLGAARKDVRNSTRAATTLGFGPRFLHSTGQYHKGGPDTGRFVQLVDVAAAGPDVPGRDYSFGTLIRAQAAGDAEALEDAGRRLVRIGLDGPRALRLLAGAVATATGRATQPR